ncbi:hypothetical protein ACLMJK_005943 [Lecanora helva]
MSNLDEKSVIGASIIRPHQEPTTLLPPQPSHLAQHKPSFDSLSPCSSNTAVDTYPPKVEDYDPTSSNPFSAFYSHPRTRTSFEQAKSESNLHLPLYSHDLESGSRITHASVVDAVLEPPTRIHNDDKVWPCSRQKEKTLLEKQHEGRRCSPFRRLSKKQKFWVKALLAILIVGAVTGLGLGISKAVNGGVFRNTQNSSAPISGR